MASNVKYNFESARRYYNDVAVPNRNQIPGEIKQLEEYTSDGAELDPANRTYRFLSQHRKNELERRIGELVQKIEVKLHPVQEKQSERIQKQIDAVRALMTSSNDLNKTIKQLHPDLKQKIYYAAWLGSGAPQDNRFGAEQIKKDPTLLQRKFPALFAPMEGTLLEQIAADLAMECQIAVHTEKQEQPQLNQLIQQRDDQKVAIFNARLNEIHWNNYQILALQETLSAAAKNRVPQPPYYGRGFNPELYNTLGAHWDRTNGKTTFRVYAPNAREITLNLTAWQRIEHSLPMVKRENGIWEAQTEHAQPGRTYHFMIVGKDGGAPFKKIDPFAFGNVIHNRKIGEDNHESAVRDIDKNFAWNDAAWMAGRGYNPQKSDMAIYEVHPSWQRKPDGSLLNWREFAHELSTYVKEMGYSHVELMGLIEHPQPESMGYQVTSYFTINNDMGSIEDFQYFVNHMHEQGIGVIGDWVPHHFAVNDFSLHSFDGTPLFEDDDDKQRYNHEWGAYEFDFKKQYTKDFLGSNLNFLLKKFHLDGLRVDAVKQMLNLNSDPKRPPRYNARGDGEHLDAKAFLRNLNTFVHKQYPGTLMIAEDASAFPNLTRPVTERGQQVKTRGVGFDMTWHMGWTNVALKYFKKSPQERKQAHFDFTFTLKGVDGYVDDHTRGTDVIPLSHDECANGKESVVKQMGGNSEYDKFANGRLFLAYQALRGGGPILDCMGNEILQSQEWHARLKEHLYNPWDKHKASVQREELNPNVDPSNHKFHIGAQESRKTMLHLRHNNPGLQDQTEAGWSWIRGDDSENGVMSFHRRGHGQQFACIFNSSDKDLWNYEIPLDSAPELNGHGLTGVREVYNTDDKNFGGLGRTNSHVEIRRDWSGRPTHFKLRLPPYTAIVLEEYFS